MGVWMLHPVRARITLRTSREHPNDITFLEMDRKSRFEEDSRGVFLDEVMQIRRRLANINTVLHGDDSYGVAEPIQDAMTDVELLLFDCEWIIQKRTAPKMT